MPSVVFAHGWGFDRSLWAETIKVFKIKNYLLPDFGYTGKRHVSNICQIEPTIGIGHSLGFAWLLKNLQNPLCLISISGFDCFYRIHDRKTIENMRTNLKRNTLAQMVAFHKKAGSRLMRFPHFEEIYLIEGISYLLSWDFKEKLNNSAMPIHAIASENDKIVPLGHTKRIFQNARLRIIETGDHVIPTNNRSEYFKFLEDVFREFGI